MCYEWEKVLHCFECQREYSRVFQRFLCPDAQSGRPCVRFMGGGQVLSNDDTCAECKRFQKNEEECQRIVHKMKPLYFNLDKKRAIHESYWRRVNMIKKESKKVTELVEENAKVGKSTVAFQKLDQASKPAPPFISMRHTPSTFTPPLEVTHTIPLR